MYQQSYLVSILFQRKSLNKYYQLKGKMWESYEDSIKIMDVRNSISIRMILENTIINK